METVYFIVGFFIGLVIYTLLVCLSLRVIKWALGN